MAIGAIPAGVRSVAEGGTGTTSIGGMAAAIGCYNTPISSNSSGSFQCYGFLTLVMASRGSYYWYGTINRWGEVHIIDASQNDLLTVTSTDSNTPVITVKNNYTTGSMALTVIGLPLTYGH